MEWRLAGIDSPFFTTMDEDETIGFSEEFEGDSNFPSSGHHYKKSRGMLSTPADVKEYPNAYVFIIDMPGLESTEIKVQIEDTNLLTIRGIRKRVEEDDQEKERVKYVRMERRMGKFLRKFKLPEDANTDAVSAVSKDGVLNVTVEKLAPPEPKQPKSIEVKVA